MGIDVQAKRQDIIRISQKFFSQKGRPRSLPIEDLFQEIFLAIVHKNCTKSAHDPRKSSFGHYVYMITNNVCCNIVARARSTTRIPEGLCESFSELDPSTLENL